MSPKTPRETSETVEPPRKFIDAIDLCAHPNTVKASIRDTLEEDRHWKPVDRGAEEVL